MFVTPIGCAKYHVQTLRLMQNPDYILVGYMLMYIRNGKDYGFRFLILQGLDYEFSVYIFFSLGGLGFIFCWIQGIIFGLDIFGFWVLCFRFMVQGLRFILSFVYTILFYFYCRIEFTIGIYNFVKRRIWQFILAITFS